MSRLPAATAVLIGIGLLCCFATHAQEEGGALVSTRNSYWGGKVNKKRQRVRTQTAPEITVNGKKCTPIVFTSKMHIDADGAGDSHKSDRTGQGRTSLTHPRKGRGKPKYLDPAELSFFVLPIGFEKKHKGVKLGDLAAVEYNGKHAFAIYGDRGPKTKIGEGSIRLARSLGIPANPNHGGVETGVRYIVFPGSGNGRGQQQDAIKNGAAPYYQAFLKACSNCGNE